MATASSFKVGTARARPGAWSTGTLTLGHYPDGPITTPVNILCGTRPGPVLWVQSAIHGAECGGALGLLRLFKRIDVRRMKGAIVGVMAANPTAFRVLGRNTPYDGENMNRLFEKPSRTGHSRQAAATLIETAMGVADAAMDMHSGGQDTVVPFYSIYWEDGSPASKRGAELARATGTKAIWNSTDAWLGGAMYTAMTKRGKPAIIVECGSGGDLNDRDVGLHMGAIAGVAKAMGILPGRPKPASRILHVGTCDLLYNQRGGYFLPAVEVGAVVRKGQVIGRLMDPHGRIVEELASPKRSYIAALVREHRAIHSGTMCAECCDVLRG
ncbi:MAG: succinylglutamate desuccinylase/aspartoacylase family protein [Alphaproteobacteria bacterium]|nr:succinylglutamate desuccinylase/aspartoacylase family protein [Alphaproteobacteria bacterium]